MNSASTLVAPTDQHPWFAWLARELAPTPGRGAAAARVALSTALVILISMTLGVPSASLSAFIVLAISNRNLATTFLAGILLVVGVTLALGSAVLVLPYVVDRPELRTPLVALLLLSGMYLSRVFVIGPLAFATAFIMARAVGDVTAATGGGEPIVRGYLWTWVAVSFPIAVTVAIGRLTRPKTQLTVGGAAPHPAAPQPKAKFSLFKPGAFADPSHLRFAIKVTLAGMFCYLTYTAVAWPGINTALTTCCFCALESTGASLRKMYLRITGCLIGGALGVISLVYLVPHMESIVSLLLLSAGVAALTAWIALGSEHISYAGAQINFAYFMCVLQQHAPPTDLRVIRDRVVGILFGIVTISLVLRYLWPERATDRLRGALAQLLRQVAEFVVAPGIEKRAVLTKQFEATQRVAELATFEMDFHHPEEVARKRRLDEILGQAETCFLDAGAVVPKPELPERVEISRRLQAEAEALTALKTTN